MSDLPEPEIDRLFAAWLDRRLDEAGAQRLLALLDDPSARRRWRELSDLDGWLAERHGMPTVRRRWPGRVLFVAGLAAAAVLAVVILRPTSPPSIAVVAAIEGDVQRLYGGQTTLTVGAELPAGAQVLLADGARAQLRVGGAIIDLLGGSRLTLPAIAAGDIALHAGRIHVQVDPAAAIKPGVVTAHALIKVTGTRFTVAVDAFGSDLLVDEGTVNLTAAGVTRAVPAGSRTRVIPGQTALLAPIGSGLRGTYFAGMDFATPLFTRDDPTVDLDWTDAGPGQGAPTTFYSVRWTGTVTALSGGEWTFIATADDGVRVWIEERLVIDRVRIGGAVTTSGTATLVAGRAHRIRIDYSQHIQWATLRLQWEGPGQARCVVPTAAFHPSEHP